MKVSATITIDVGQFDFEDDANKKRTLKRKHNLDDWLQRHAIDINAVICGPYDSLEISKAVIQDD